MENPAYWNRAMMLINDEIMEWQKEQNLSEAERPVGGSLGYRIATTLEEAGYLTPHALLKCSERN